MSSSAMLSTARGKEMAVWSDVTLTQVTRSPPATFASMQRYAGERKRWLQLIKPEISTLLVRHWKKSRTGQLQRRSNEWQKREKWLTVIDSTQQQSLGAFLFHTALWPDLTWPDRAEIVRWIAESKRPFQIVNDRGFQSLMKTGRPEYHLPSMQTVSRDVKRVFVQARKRIAKMLQVRWATIYDLKKLYDLLMIGIRGSIEFCHRRVDIPQPQSICGIHSPFRTWGSTGINAPRYCWSCEVALRGKSRCCIWKSPWRVWDQW